MIAFTSLLSIRHFSREIVWRCMWYSHGLICSRRSLPFVVSILLVRIAAMDDDRHLVRDVEQEAVAHRPSTTSVSMYVPLR